LLLLLPPCALWIASKIYHRPFVREQEQRGYFGMSRHGVGIQRKKYSSNKNGIAEGDAWIVDENRLRFCKGILWKNVKPLIKNK